MTSPAAPPQTDRQQAAQAGTATVIGTLAVVLASGMNPVAVSAAALPLLAMLGIPPETGVKALSLVIPHDLPLEPDTPTPGPVESRTAIHEALYRARYLANASNRLHRGTSIEQERAHAQQHIGAQRARAEAARKVDAAMRQHGSELGWYAVLDDVTTPDCRAANGSNFSALTPPKIGLPGSVHGACRCRAGAPHPGARTVDQATAKVTHHDTRPDVIPFPVELSNAPRRRFERARSVLSRSHA